MSTPLKAVLAGCGGMSRGWLKTAVQIEGLQIVGLVDIIEDAARARRDEFGLSGTQTGDDLAAMLRVTRPDIVFDVTVPEAHADNAVTAFAHSCHVLSEKPLADSMAHAYRALEASRIAGRQYAVMQNRRYLHGARRIKALLDSGALGPLTTVNIDFFVGAHFGGFREHMRHVLLLDMAIHTFDALRYLSGADAHAVYCHEWNPSGSWYDHDASAVAIFEMSNGIVATYRGSWCSEGQLTQWESDWRFLGTDGSVTWDGNAGFNAQRRAPGAETGFFREMQPVAIPEFDTSAVESGHDSLIRDFIDCVRSGRRPLTHAEDNVRSLSMVFGAIDSAGKRARVEI
jgi:predicted dehydrogenase